MMMILKAHNGLFLIFLREIVFFPAKAPIKFYIFSV
jgi:hypothetical protein